jgi:hypothetical protein
VIYAAGIRGNHHCRTCPLAQLLSLLTGIAVGVDRCYAYTPRDLVMIAPLPSAARDFLMKFDRGWPIDDCAYPELELELEAL